MTACHVTICYIIVAPMEWRCDAVCVCLGPEYWGTWTYLDTRPFVVLLKTSESRSLLSGEVITVKGC